MPYDLHVIYNCFKMKFKWFELKYCDNIDQKYTCMNLIR